MAFLDPRECLAARDSLQVGNYLEAAQVLLNCSQQQHRAVRQLLLEIGKQACEAASTAHREGNFVAAWLALQCAAQCCQLSPEYADLHRILEHHHDEQKRHKAWHEEQLKQAQQWAAAGRFHSALIKLDQLSESPEAVRFRREWQGEVDRGQRYLQEARDLLAQDQPAAAQKRLKMARELMPDHADLPILTAQLQQLAPDLAFPTDPPFPIVDRTQPFAIGPTTLVVSMPQIVIGTPRGEAVDLMIVGPLRSRHALLLRDHGRYRILPLLDRHGSPCLVLINGEAIDNPRLLIDGDRIELGTRDCCWLFRLPVADSSTAVLEPAQVGVAGMQLRNSAEYRRVILLDKELQISARQHCHLCWPQLPCDSVTFHWQPEGLGVHTLGGWCHFLDQQLSQESPEGLTDATRTPRVTVPSRLIIQGEFDEAELLGRSFAGDPASCECEIPLWNPFSP